MTREVQLQDGYILHVNTNEEKVIENAKGELVHRMSQTVTTYPVEFYGVSLPKVTVEILAGLSRDNGGAIHFKAGVDTHTVLGDLSAHIEDEVIYGLQLWTGMWAARWVDEDRALSGPWHGPFDSKEEARAAIESVIEDYEKQEE